jgi:nucleoside phosphorylase
MPCAVILTALPVEYEAVRAHLSALFEDKHKGTTYERGKFISNGQEWEVGILQVGAGNARAAAHTERAIAYFKPVIIIFVGVAGGIKDVALGDVVAATKVYNYESGKEKEEFEPRPDPWLPTYDLIEQVRIESRKSDWWKRLRSPSSSTPQVLLAPIATGEKVIASTQSKVFKLLQQNYGDAVAVEMEAGGLLQAAYFNSQVWALVIRGISDLIDGKSAAYVSGSQEIAACNASAFAFEVLAKLKLNEVNSKTFDNQPSTGSLSPSSIISNSDEWVMLDHSFFLTESVLETNQTVTLEILPTTTEQENILRDLQSEHFNKKNIAYAYHNEAAIMQLEKISSKSSRGRNIWSITLSLKKRSSQVSNIETNYNSYSADQIADFRVRLLLLNEAPDIQNSNDFALNHLVEGSSDNAIKITKNIFPALWTRFKNQPELFLFYARLTAVYYLKMSGTIERILELNLRFIEHNVMSVEFGGRKKSNNSHKDADVIQIQGNCYLNR